jgi:hypothetical protein
MDMFNIKRRDNPSMDKYSDLKKPGFGGPNSAEPFDKSKRKSLEPYQRVVDRNADFEGGKFNHNYDPTWKAVTRDLISRTSKKKPFDPMYAKPTIATVDAVEEAARIRTFEEFLNESEGFNMFAEAETDEPLTDEPMEGSPEDVEVDAEQLENLMDEFGEEIEDLISDIAEKMEIDREEVAELLCTAVKRMSEAPAEEEEEDSEESENPEDEE